MTLVLSYCINYVNSDGCVLDADVDVNFPHATNNFSDASCDETARRYIISKILAEGGRVIKINRDGHKWKKYEKGD